MKKIICIIICVATLLTAIIPAFATSEGSTQVFSDVPTTHWAYEFINWAFNEGAVSGTSYNQATGTRTFSPDAKLTNSQFCLMLAQKFFPEYLEYLLQGKYPYNARYVQDYLKNWKYAALAAMDWANGRSNNEKGYSKRIDKQVTREEAAYQMWIVLKAYGINPLAWNDTESVLSGVPGSTDINNAYREAVASLYNLGLLTGTSNGNLAPKMILTRAQAATLLKKLSDYVDSRRDVFHGRPYTLTCDGTMYFDTMHMANDAEAEEIYKSIKREYIMDYVDGVVESPLLSYKFYAVIPVSEFEDGYVCCETYYSYSACKTPQGLYEGNDISYMANAYSQIKSRYNLNEYSTEYEKVYAIYNYLTQNFRYDYGFKNYSAWRLLRDGKGVCASYAEAMCELCYLFGIECEKIRGTANYNGGNHAWSLVKVDGQWYQCDATWDLHEYNHPYQYFLISDRQMSKDHTFKAEDYPECPENYR